MAEVAEYSVTLHNRTSPTTNAWSFCLFQEVPDGCTPGILQLAWLVRPCAYGNNVKFKWQVKYEFQWAQTGALKDGAVFESSGSMPCVPGDPKKNSAQLAKVASTYQLQPYSQSAAGDNLLIHCGEHIDASISIGVSMGGKSAFATPATSNSSHLFVPHPTYYATFGIYEEGQVMDHQASVDPLKIEFMGYHNMDITLNSEYQWETSTLEKANEERMRQAERARAIERAALEMAAL